jgi:hypothetical protein
VLILRITRIGIVRVYDSSIPTSAAAIEEAGGPREVEVKDTSRSQAYRLVSHVDTQFTARLVGPYSIRAHITNHSLRYDHAIVRAEERDPLRRPGERRSTAHSVSLNKDLRNFALLHGKSSNSHWNCLW